MSADKDRGIRRQKQKRAKQWKKPARDAHTGSTSPATLKSPAAPSAH